MRHIHRKKNVLATPIFFSSPLSLAIQRRFRSVKALPYVLARRVQQPGMQYRLALLLATLLSFLLGWRLFVSTLSHMASLALSGHPW
jgi:hypothetical protein